MTDKEFEARVRALRDREITPRQDELAALQATQRNPAEVRELLRRQFAMQRAELGRRIRSDLAALAAGEASRNLLRGEVVHEATRARRAEVSFSPVLVTLLGEDALLAAVEQYMDAVPDAPPAAERAARGKTLQAELDQFEQEEEALICEAEASGVTVLRRANARPEIVLGIAEPAELQRDTHKYAGLGEIPAGRGKRVILSAPVGSSRS